MRNYLHGASQIIPVSLFIQHIPVHLTCRQIAELVEILIDKTLVMTQIQIGLCSVLRYKNFPMLIRTHGARVDIDVRIQLLRRNFQPSCF